MQRTGGKAREITAPRQRLADVQWLLNDFLKRLGQPDYLHSGIKGRSHLTNARAHLGQAWVATIDLRSFYHQVSAAQVRRFFVGHLQCSAKVAALLTRLCTVDDRLPLGGRTSQLLAFLANKPMFDALAKLARNAGVNFTAYVDDLCFSGCAATPAFLWKVKQTIHAFGMHAHHGKCFGPGRPRTVTGAVLTSRGLTTRPLDRKRVQYDMRRAATGRPDLHQLQVLQGRLAAATSIDPSYAPVLRSVQTQLKKLRANNAEQAPVLLSPPRKPIATADA